MTDGPKLGKPPRSHAPRHDGLLGTLLHAALRSRKTRRRTESPPGPGTQDPDTRATAASAPDGDSPVPDQRASLWRMRTTVREEPGSLAALCTALAGRHVDILSLQTHPLGPGAPGGPAGAAGLPERPGGERTVDEFVLRVPAALAPDALRDLVAEAGGSETWLERADTHELVDAPARILALATRTALDAAELPLALRELLGRCTIQSVPAVSPLGHRMTEEVPPGGVLEDHLMRLPDPSGGAIVVERPHLPFTPTEFARARALVELDARLGQRLPRRRDALTLPEGHEITVRRADTRDLEAARAMHERCSKRTLALRYHGPSGDADRYLAHLLSPRFGRTLAVETASGKLVALGHLLWDGEESEAALIVEDAWQQRGIGAELLRRLVALAVEARSECVYAVTQASNTGMVATMRGLGLPLDYQVEEGTLVVTARLTPVPAESGAEAAAEPAAESGAEAAARTADSERR